MDSATGQLNPEQANQLTGILLGLLKNSNVFKTDSMSQQYVAPPTTVAFQINDFGIEFKDKQFGATMDLLAKSFPNIAESTLTYNVRNWFYEIARDVIVDESLESEFERGAYFSLLGAKKLSDSFLHEKIAELDSLLNGLIEKCLVLVPIEGIVLKIDELKIGDVTFYPNDKGPLQENIKLWEQQNPDQGPFFNNPFGPPNCYAAIFVTGDSAFIDERSVQEIQNAIHIVNFYRAVADRRRQGWQNVGIVGRQPSLRSSPMLSSIISTQERVSYTVTFHGYTWYEIDTNSVEQWKLNHFEQLSTYFTDLYLPVGEKIRPAIIWYSKSTSGGTLEERFISLAVALEVLVGEDEQEKSKMFAGRISYLLGNNHAERVDLATRIFDLYRIRNDVLHEGKFVSQKAYDDFDAVVLKAILAFISAG